MDRSGNIKSQNFLLQKVPHFQPTFQGLSCNQWGEPGLDTDTKYCHDCHSLLRGLIYSFLWELWLFFNVEIGNTQKCSEPVAQDFKIVSKHQLVLIQILFQFQTIYLDSYFLCHNLFSCTDAEDNWLIFIMKKLACSSQNKKETTFSHQIKPLILPSSFSVFKKPLSFRKIF